MMKQHSREQYGACSCHEKLCPTCYNDDSPHRNKAMNYIRNIYITIITAVAVFTILHLTIVGFRVSGPCMTPNILNGHFIMVSKVAYAFAEPERGDVIGFFTPQEPYVKMLKRIIGLPGESVEIREGTVFVNDMALDEPYINEEPLYTFARTTIPEDNYFVLGDNRNFSTDSHTGYTVPKNSIIGKVLFSYWPFPESGFARYFSFEQALGSR